MHIDLYLTSSNLKTRNGVLPLHNGKEYWTCLISKEMNNTHSKNGKSNF